MSEIDLTLDPRLIENSALSVAVGADSAGYVYGSEYPILGTQVNDLPVSTPSNFLNTPLNCNGRVLSMRNIPAMM